ncbi:hypothetical protein IGI04_009934 [Brassica rapa subsp. trilocularis]|uniref:Uncharacterized protein n=1 Tax=Brassica rapa subsp. trilocularis TaxID=1813537 RepID=A0ABQ7MYQ2_BRACM|nr:hypothetical protein IGI04_009934 [Brassica rapa subsp. trilocularis]
MDTSKDSVGAAAAPLLITLLGVEMTEKQLAERFNKTCVKEDPLNEPFDPTRHNVVFHVPDASKPEGTFAHVLKASHFRRMNKIPLSSWTLPALPEKPWFCNICFHEVIKMEHQIHKNDMK